MRTRSRGSQLGLLLLASQLFQVGLDNIPPVTLGVLGLNVYLYMFPAAPLMQTCVSVQQAYWFKDWRRLLLSPFHHVDDLHLYFNMASFLMKGIRLERRLGGAWFLYLLSVFSLLTGLVYLMLEMFLTELTQDQSYSMACAVGFSGVLFALKVINNYYHPGGVTYVMGVSVPNRYASWVELVLIHITAPGTSLIGHLAGILVGLLYTAGPLKTAMKSCAGFVTSSRRSFQPATYFRSSGYSGTRGGYHQPYQQYDTRNPAASYTDGLTEEQQLAAAIRNSLNERGYSNTGGGYPGNRQHVPNNMRNPAASYTDGLTEEQQLEAAIRNSLNERGPASRRAAPPPPYGFHLSDDEARAEEIRRMRLRRFDS